VDSILRAILRDEMISWHKKVILQYIYTKIQYTLVNSSIRFIPILFNEI
jgi:hypothetical protein